MMHKLMIILFTMAKPLLEDAPRNANESWKAS